MADQITDTVSLSAQARVFALQDKAEVQLALAVVEDSAPKAQKAMADAVERLQRAAKKQGFAAQVQERRFNDQMEQRGKQQSWEKTGKTEGKAVAIVVAYDFEKLAEFLEAVAEKKLAIVGASETSISGKARMALEAKLTEEAIDAFNAKAKLVAKAFGAKKFALGEISIGEPQGESRGYHRAMSMSVGAGMMREAAHDDTQGYVSAREESLTVEVSGTIVLSR